MDQSDLNRVLLITLLFSIANLSSICALKSTKLDSIQLGPYNSNSDFSQFLELESNSMATSLYSLIQTGVNTGKNINEIMESILNIRNQLEKDFRYNQQIYRNKKLNIENNLNEKNLDLKLKKEKLLGYEREKQKLKAFFNEYQTKTSAIRENLSFINAKITSEADLFEEKSSILNFYLQKNAVIISFARLIYKIVLEENRIPEIKFQLAFEYSEDKAILNAKVIYHSTEKIENPFEKFIANAPSKLFNNSKTLNSTELSNKLGKGVYVDEAFLVFEHILKISSDRIVNDLNTSSPSVSMKERILNLLNNLIKMKENQNTNLNQQLKANEDLKTKLFEQYNKLKEFYLNKLLEFGRQMNSNGLSEVDFEDKLKLIEQEELLTKKSLVSIVGEIKFYSETQSLDEKQYAELVERTKFFVKAINQIKKHMINNFGSLKDYLLTRKL